ncbi:hypothetical protein ERO13_A11G076700v2 [Gossypium hirsutum]|uniref:Uncharacterized protein n=2 Tax=Gossypium TaxID=3633 RepID=A0A1U8JYH5_GOSHI|nr:uncharacterized protein LOC107911876 [Gossypium hirsutum]XP_016695333.2 uncharacterized protein LOC107911876 [Gossypium hirsutum]XP_040936809.1 uncharacterized protein LOC107911876 [Gossypium hirsutum]XP_040936810.1 uncharacterized protein LOC107911876 [Gossypium hirsutum]TYJ08597.1 hypothetical protein E1A91_A11G085900v1 [Gossypium mustelinum]KAG4173704.1 hypothetical protein ERO13_A11G076700v2 [Gossypium hirsutum]KAG4173705.1 hypothetical protein ERO13_A11G076700v2 [Gossypium hirsutum]K
MFYRSVVFPSISERKRNSNRSKTDTVMASSSSSSALKSQPLHNFQLHDLKWAMNHTGNHRLRKLSDSLHKSPQRGESGSESDNNRKVNPVCEARSKIGHSSGFSPDHRTGKSERKFIDGSDVLVDFNSDKKVDPSDARSKIYIRFPAKNDKSVDEVADVGDQSLITEDIEELVPKTWTLRPRKPICKPSNHNGSSLKIGASAHENKTHRSEATRSRNVTEPKVAEKKEKKQKFSVSLSREEIDDDIFAMTGSKASRRPKKRAKSVQKQLDCVFPGLWLASITPDCYRVTEAPVKG